MNLTLYSHIQYWQNNKQVKQKYCLDQLTKISFTHTSTPHIVCIYRELLCSCAIT